VLIVYQYIAVMSRAFNKILILCIDRDNDVGERLRINTPVIGKENLMKIATEYILKYPDDSDANAIFGAIQLYESLVSSMGQENVEVALVTGSSSEDFLADMKLISEVDKVLNTFNAEAFIVVSDGPSDEVVVPLLQSRRPVISVRRIVVKQVRGLEEFAILAKHYMNKIYREPRYRKYALGIPGILILLYGLWALIPSEIQTIISAGISILIGMLLLITALNAHEVLLRFLRRYETTFFACIVSISLALVYPLTSIYVFHINAINLLLQRPTIFDVLGLAASMVLIVNAAEIYIKRGIKPYGRVLTSIMVILFPVLVLDPFYSFSVGHLLFIDLVKSILTYFAINTLCLLIIEYLRRRKFKFFIK